MTNQPTTSQPETTPVPVVAIGASAGGLEQIKLLLHNLPADTGAAFVVIQHLDPKHESHLTELLAQAATLPVVAIEDGMPLAADRVHVLAPGQRLGFDDRGTLRLTASQAREARPTLIDGFFRDLAAALGRRAVGIVLSGTGSDGALGLKAIRAAGGLAMAQLPDNAEFDGMPRAAARHASPDCLLDTADMAPPLYNHLRLTLAGREQPTETAAGDDQGNDAAISDATLNAALETLRAHSKYDFRHHKPAMLKRRMARRMTLNGVSSTRTYLDTLRNDGRERSRLRADFLISVTDFFREPESYIELNDAVLRKLLDNRSVDSPVRVWVPGCATGEEAYSIAMLLAEAIRASGREHSFIVFATDIDETALATARAGVFPESIEADLSSERLRLFFDKVDDHYQIKRSLRERVVFAPQSVTDDPPYSRLDLISCRNLLIYLNAETQHRLIRLFHFALKETGFLFLGGSETVGKQIDLFEPLSKEHRVYQRLTSNHPYRVDFPAPQGMRAEAPAGYRPHADYSRQPQNAEQIARDILLAEHVPASVLINRKLEILCSYGPTHDYLALPLGESSLDLMAMVRAEYRSHLRAVTHRAFRDEHESNNNTTLQDASGRMLVINARPLRRPEQARGLVLITFERLPEAGTAHFETDSTNDLERQLSEELDTTRNELHGTIAALEESNEDLKGSNEEVMSMNEELQSTNEELETSKEELQSVNEELTTVNTELESKVSELETAHNDLANLFAGTQVATLFLDRALRIKRFTPAIREQLNLISADIGRPLRDMTLKFDDPDLLADADRVLNDLTAREAEVASSDGEHWYQRRITPYRTRDDTIDGVVISFADITEVKTAMLAAREHEVRLDLAVSALAGGIWEMAIDSEAPDTLPNAIYLSERLKKLLGFTGEQLPNNLNAWLERIVPEDQAAYSDVAHRRQRETEQPLHYRIRHRDGSIRWLASYGTIIRGAHDRWIGIDCDITDTKQAQIRLHHLQARLQLLIDALPERIAFIDQQQLVRFCNAAFRDGLDLDTEMASGCGVAEMLGEATWAQLAASAETALKGKTVGCNFTLPDGVAGEHNWQAQYIPHCLDGAVTGYYLLLADRSQHAETSIDWKQDGERLVYIQRMAAIGEMASTLAHDLNQPLSAINSYASALVRMIHAGKPADDTVPVVRKISDQVQRAGNITSDVRRFVGHGNPGHVLLDISDVLQTAVSLTSGRVRKMGVEMQVSEQSPLPQIYGDDVQLQQVVVNLITNALDAMQATPQDQRTLWLTTQQPDATQVQMVIEDAGPGIVPSELEAVFESFHSSKLEGMGMGLSMCRTIIQWHGGRLWAETQPDHGATFFLTLPASQGEHDHA